jgi:hypothetical protein
MGGEGKQDLTTQLKEAAFSFRGLADKLKFKAAECRKEIEGWPAGSEPVRQEEAKAADYDRKAALWEERARVADEGYLLDDPSDPQWTLDRQYTALRTEAARQHRMRFVEMEGAGGVQPGPIERGAKPAQGLFDIQG